MVGIVPCIGLDWIAIAGVCLWLWLLVVALMPFFALALLVAALRLPRARPVAAALSRESE
jgi:hypothetical protein